MVPDDPEARVIVIPLPTFPGPDGEPTVVGAMGGRPWVVNAFNDDGHMRVAIDFLNWWYLPETRNTFITEHGGLPWTREDVNDPQYTATVPSMRSFEYTLGEGRSRDFWHLPQYSELLAVQQEAFDAFATGEITSARAALDYVAAKQQQILYDAGSTTTPPPQVRPR